jgi:hypothetical protein
MGMPCTTHPDQTARVCDRCHGPFCPGCAHSDTTCRDCGYATLAAAASDHAQGVAHAPHSPSLPQGAAALRLPAGLVVLGLLLFAFAASPPLFPRRVHGAAGGPNGATDAGYQRCVANMWDLRSAIETWAIQHAGDPPTSLADLPGDLGSRACPALRHTYGYAVQPAAEVEPGEQPAFYLACPDPDHHGVTAIEAGPEMIAPVVTP